MHISQLISISLFIIALTITIYAWMDRLTGSNAKINEAFENPGLSLDKIDIEALKKSNEPEPTDADATRAHQTLLRFIRNDFGKGVKFVMDFGKRFYGDNLHLRKDLVITTLMDNYNSPLQVI